MKKLAVVVAGPRIVPTGFETPSALDTRATVATLLPLPLLPLRNLFHFNFNSVYNGFSFKRRYF
jgi:hypothetical protein